jgi:D-inositol-3-phosphate glycosyltransferase
VAVIEPVGGHGGCNYYDFSLCKGILNAGGHPRLYTCDQTAVAGDEGFPIALNYRGIYGKASPWLRGLRYLRGSISSLIGAKKHGARVAHYHFFHVGALELFNVLLAKSLRLRVVITAHDVEAFKKGLSVPIFVKWAYLLADKVIAHNRVSRDELVNVLNVPSSSLSVIPHGNYLEYVPPGITRAVARAQLGFVESERVVLFFGQIKEVKGLNILIEAFAKALQKDSALRLVIAGKVWKDDFSKYQQLITAHSLQEVCSCHIRYIPDAEVPIFYQCADLVALPYLKIYQSGVVLMAMSYGRSVLVSDIPGMMEVVVDTQSGFVFRSGDADHMAARINEVFETPRLLERVAAGGLKKVTEEYDWDEIGRLTLASYTEIA